MFFLWAAMDVQPGACASHKISVMMIWSIIIAHCTESILGTTTENYNERTTDFSYSGAVNATLNRTFNDPCSNYTILSESWRNVNASLPTSVHCGSLLIPEQWYLVEQPAGNATPETAPPINSCGTNTSTWLHGTHPRSVSSTPVERLLCANWDGNRCQFSTMVQVAFCSGGYYVYKANWTGIPSCDLEWCAVDTNAAISPNAICEQQGNFYCSLSQRCVSSNYRCDGSTNCFYGEDETGCASSSTAPAIAPSSCGSTLYGSGYVGSPNYPSNYANYLTCNWTLIASPYNEDVVLTFLAFSTESCCDFVSIYNSSGDLVTRFSGTIVPSTIVLPNRALISFTTDVSLVLTGFSIWFNSSDASATIPSARISCESDGNFYCASSYLCISMSYRCDGYTYCYHGEDEVGCSTLAPPATSTSSSSCGGTLYGSGYIRSPNYPLYYDNNLHCNWTLYASPYHGNILLQFNAFNTESGYDYLSIYNSSGALVNRYSGTFFPNNIALGSTAVVGFNADSSSVDSGFSIWFSTSVPATTTLSPRDICEQQGYFYCALSNICIESWRRCDGYIYCYHGEDEAGCNASSTTRTPSLVRDGCLRQGRFYCQTGGTCIDSSWRCDGINDCLYNEDELGCTTITSAARTTATYTTTTSATTQSPRDNCESKENFYCASSYLCVPMSQRCNGYYNCNYGEDEAGCGTSAPPTSTSEQPRESFAAASGFAQAFLQLSKSSASELPRGSWIVVSGYVTALLLGLPRFGLY